MVIKYLGDAQMRHSAILFIESRLHLLILFVLPVTERFQNALVVAIVQHLCPCLSARHNSRISVCFFDDEYRLQSLCGLFRCEYLIDSALSAISAPVRRPLFYPSQIRVSFSTSPHIYRLNPVWIISSLVMFGDRTGFRIGPIQPVNATSYNSVLVVRLRFAFIIIADFFQYMRLF